MDSAAMAAQSDPVRNKQFGRPWTGPPVWNRRGPGRDTRANFEKLNLNSERSDSTPARAAQRAMLTAVRRAEELDRRACLLAAIGLADAALRAAAIAAEIRAVLA